MTVQPTPSGHNRHRAFVAGHPKPHVAARVKLHTPDNHYSWLSVALFLDKLPQRTARS